MDLDPAPNEPNGVNSLWGWAVFSGSSTVGLRPRLLTAHCFAARMRSPLLHSGLQLYPDGG